MVFVNPENPYEIKNPFITEVSILKIKVVNKKRGVWIWWKEWCPKIYQIIRE